MVYAGLALNSCGLVLPVGWMPITRQTVLVILLHVNDGACVPGRIGEEPCRDDIGRCQEIPFALGYDSAHD